MNGLVSSLGRFKLILPELWSMHNFKNNLDVTEFLRSGFELKSHLANYLEITKEKLEELMPNSSEDLAAIHPGSLASEEVLRFYEKEVGTAHLIELSAWHLSSRDYISDTLRLQGMFAKGQVLDFGGGIGTHALAAAALPEVEHVWFVDLNPHNRNFVIRRAKSLGMEKNISVHRDLDSTGNIKFDTLVCLDVLEHIPNPSEQLIAFKKRLSKNSVALLNWYFFKGFKGEYPFHFDDPSMIAEFFKYLQSNFLEIFHPYLITTRAYKPI